ncbi:MAG TPA: diaminopimelate epimerase [Capsulimonadaceae bacterium]|jgi:diaminopimelate epimerase
MIEFVKMQAIGNDFVVVAANDVASLDLPTLALRLCDRHFGVGSDGMLVVGGDFGEGVLGFRMFNPDGSEDMCGNGLRCALLWAYRHGHVIVGKPLFVHGFDRNRECVLLAVSSEMKHATVSVDMGEADFAPANVPFLGPNNGRRLQSYNLAVADTVVALSPVSTGSTHTVAFLDAPIDEDRFRALSPLIENHQYFPERTSIMWTVPRDGDVYDVRIWERAAGETLGCGTGATAIAAVAWAEGRSAPTATITVRSKGGELQFTQSPDGSIRMTGPAEWVFSGLVA